MPTPMVWRLRRRTISFRSDDINCSVLDGVVAVAWVLPADYTAETMSTATVARPSKFRHMVCVVLGLALPGLGHWVLGQRARGAIIFVAIGLTFWIGLAIGGVRSTIDPVNNRAWFVAQICCGTHTLGALALARAVPDRLPYRIGWPSLDLGVVYTGVAGLLNILVVLDLVARAGGAVPGRQGGSG
jgi:hypothetical protein